ncbi:hypothetical protein CROQUDRAFT_103214 [Cronartium quercuum f. sp. fusiforme G11]|uniref:Uncharacterized protein n=1 Tax=Cronartium quercuum f. sp. fusiforme G11 TaxID=708437 RepID=A0A9P6NXQ9_9BASI|nr:hypothetical protein CROQUDRAFT_103214 [Cronartium quercuum f. sp. fusiforme G11]
MDVRRGGSGWRFGLLECLKRFARFRKINVKLQQNEPPFKVARLVFEQKGIPPVDAEPSPGATKLRAVGPVPTSRAIRPLA